MKTTVNFFPKKQMALGSSIRIIMGLFTCLVLSSSGILAQENGGEQKPYEDFDPANFDENSTNITNDWMPLKPGMRYVYTGTTIEEDEAVPHRVLIHVTDLTKVIEGINTIATWDLDYSSGELVEAELAFYAQDKEGNVWRMGEYPEEYEEGEFVEAPSWFSGIEDARAGISMKGNPWLETPSYSQGWAPKVDFTDRGKVDQMGLEVCTPMGCYENVLVISETTLDEPDAFQLKYWAQGVGNIQVGFKGNDATQEHLELVDVMQLGPDGIAEIREKAMQLEKDAYERKRNKKVYGETPPMVPMKMQK